MTLPEICDLNLELFRLSIEREFFDEEDYLMLLLKEINWLIYREYIKGDDYGNNNEEIFEKNIKIFKKTKN